MDKIELYIRGEHHGFSGPEKWDEVTPEMALKLMRLATMLKEKPYAAFMIAEILYGIPQKEIRWLFDRDYIVRCEPGISKEDIDTCIEQGMALMQHCAWVFEKEPPTVWILKSFTNRDARKHFYGPADSLATSTFEEFMFAEQFYADALIEGPEQQENMAKLIACLYRVGNEKNLEEKNDARNPFTLASIDVMYKHFSKLDQAVKDLVLFNYRGVRLDLAKGFPHIFSVSEEPPENDGGSWLDVACSLAGENLMNMSAIRTENIYVVLRYLDNRIKQANELKAKTTNGH